MLCLTQSENCSALSWWEPATEFFHSIMMGTSYWFRLNGNGAVYFRPTHLAFHSDSSMKQQYTNKHVALSTRTQCIWADLFSLLLLLNVCVGAAKTNSTIFVYEKIRGRIHDLSNTKVNAMEKRYTNIKLSFVHISI